MGNYFTVVSMGKGGLLGPHSLLYILCFSKHYSAKIFEMISIVLK
jgi:hypothetical protein